MALLPYTFTQRQQFLLSYSLPSPPPTDAGKKVAPLHDQEEELPTIRPLRTQTPWLCGAAQGGQPATKVKYHRQRAGLTPINRESYQFYVLPVATLLEMSEWEPHQILLDQGKLVKGDEVEESEIIFVTHQWTSFGEWFNSPAAFTHRHT